ncbi:MAG: hypothetical protein ABSG87_07660 [Verrucomicrobiota bacterium]|jgi:hypothetical protein
MFDLEQSIAEWRKQMLAAGIKSPVPLEELEIHLREDIEQQMKSGLNKQKAFEVAVGRIGQASPLKMEFKKVGDAHQAQKRKFIVYFCVVILGVYMLAATCAMFKYNLSINEWGLGLAAQVTLLCLAGFVWRIAPPFSPLIAGRRAQSVVGLVGGISGAIWFLVFVYFILPCFDFTTGQLMVAILWAMVPTLVLPTTAFLLLDKNESQQLTPPGS